MIIETIVGALVPVAAEGLRAGFSKLFNKGGVKPLTVDEQIKLDNNEIEKLKAVAALDNPGGTPSQWVVDLRASARYITAGVVILGGIATVFTPGIEAEVKIMALEATNIVFGFLFGSRVVANWRK